MKKFIGTLLAFCGLIFSSGCSSPYKHHSDQIQVLTSFYPLYFFTSQIAGSHAEVLNLTPAGVEPHDFELSVKDVARIQDSALLIVNGYGFEPWSGKIKEELNKRTVFLSVADTIPDDTPEGESPDPHIWLSPRIASDQVTSIAAALVNTDPSHENEYRTNARELKKKLTELDADFRAGLAHCSAKTFIAAHDAFGRLAKEYGLTQKSIAGLSPDAEPSARQLAELAKFAKDNNVKYIFFESLVSPKLAETLAKEVGAETLVLNPLEGLTEEELKEGKDYFSVMRENLKNLRLALECK
jgi:zinc transport system substrate-binding protein